AAAVPPRRSSDLGEAVGVPGVGGRGDPGARFRAGVGDDADELPRPGRALDGLQLVVEAGAEVPAAGAFGLRRGRGGWGGGAGGGGGVGLGGAVLHWSGTGGASAYG